MDLDDKIGQLEDLISEVRQASLTDDKTILGSSLAFRREARSINQGESEFNVKHNPLVRLSSTCGTCGARISCNVPKLRAPAALQLCPCCRQAL